MHFRPTAIPSRLRLISGLLLVLALLSGRGVSRPVVAGELGRTSGVTSDTPSSPTAGCTVNLTDVVSSDYFYNAVHFLYCMGAMGGYADDTFRPGNDTTRGQLSKVIVVAEGWPIFNPSSPSFRDVPGSDPFYTYVETAHAHNTIGGYADGTFHPGANVTRGQLAKIIVMATRWPLLNPPSATFRNVAVGSTFFGYVETAVAHGATSGYADGTFRPGNSSTRGQIAKIGYIATAPQPTPQEQQTINLINQRRTGMGLPALNVDPALTKAARRLSYDIGPRGLCQHNGTDGSSPWDRISQAGYTGFGMGEVVGCNYSTAQAVVDAWWASPAHYAILTDASARDIGCGWWIGANGYGWQMCDTGSR